MFGGVKFFENAKPYHNYIVWQRAFQFLERLVLSRKYWMKLEREISISHDRVNANGA